MMIFLEINGRGRGENDWERDEGMWKSILGEKLCAYVVAFDLHLARWRVTRPFFPRY